MRSLTVVLDARRSDPLPLAYNHLVQGALYRCWRETAPELHDQGFGQGARTYKLFTFGRLSGKKRINPEGKTITFTDVLRFTVRSPIEELVDQCATRLAQMGEVRIGKASFPLLNLETSDRLLFPARVHITMLSPVTLHRTREDGFTEYLNPRTPDFATALQNNSDGKAQAYGIEPADVQILPLSETLKKTVISFKGVNVNGWMGDFILSTSPQMMAFLYNTGIGARNSQGFGMFSIDDRPIL